MKTLLGTFLAGLTLFSGPLYAGSTKAPRFLIVRVPIPNEAPQFSEMQRAEVFPIEMELDREADGTVDKEKVRAKIIDAMQSTQPIILGGETTRLEDLPEDLAKEFVRAEKETEDQGEEEAGAVAWRHYGPVTGYSAGVVAHGRSPYYGYTAAAARTVPYYGYYTGGQTYNYAYGAYRTTPSYHYYGYYRHY